MDSAEDFKLKDCYCAKRFNSTLRNTTTMDCEQWKCFERDEVARDDKLLAAVLIMMLQVFICGEEIFLKTGFGLLYFMGNYSFSFSIVKIVEKFV